MNSVFKIKVLSARKLTKESITFVELKLGDQHFKSRITSKSSSPNYDCEFNL